MDKTLRSITMNIYGFQTMVDETQRILNEADVLEYHGLAIHAKKACDGLSGIVSFLEEVQSALLKEKETVKVPVTYGDRPILTIVGGTDYVHNKS